MGNENVIGARPGDAGSMQEPQALGEHELERKSSQVFEQSLPIQQQESSSSPKVRHISTPLHETPLSREEAAVCNVAEPILLPGSESRPSFHFEPISDLRNDPVQKQRFLDELQKWFEYEPPPYEKIMPPPPTTKPPRRVSIFKRAPPVLQGRLEKAKNDTIYTMEFARLTKNILNNDLQDFDRKTLHDNFPGSTDFLALLHGVYDSQGNLQAIAIAGEKGNNFWVDRIANAPWNVTRSVRRDLEQYKENSDPGPTHDKVDSYLAMMADDPRVKTGWGAATSLMQHLAKTTKERGCNRISLQPTGSSEPFYEKLGFTDRGMQHCSAIDVSSDPKSAYMCLIEGRQR